MKILSIDTETTGLDTEQCMLLEFGAVIEDTLDVKPIDECPSFNCIVENSGLLLGSAFALNMNRDVLEILAGQERLDTEELAAYRKKHNIIKYEDVATEFYYFLQTAGVLDTFKLEQGKGLVKKWIDQKGEEQFVSVFTNKSKKYHMNILGKNFGTFDKIFIEDMPRWKQYFKIKNRIADPAIFFTDWKADEGLPNFKTCMERTGIDGEVSHRAFEDARDTLLMLRKATKDYTLKLF